MFVRSARMTFSLITTSYPSSIAPPLDSFHYIAKNTYKNLADWRRCNYNEINFVLNHLHLNVSDFIAPLPRQFQFIREHTLTSFVTIKMLIAFETIFAQLITHKPSEIIKIWLARQNTQKRQSHSCANTIRR